jgi:hypothetical protein
MFCFVFRVSCFEFISKILPFFLQDHKFLSFFHFIIGICFEFRYSDFEFSTCGCFVSYFEFRASSLSPKYCRSFFKIISFCHFFISSLMICFEFRYSDFEFPTCGCFVSNFEFRASKMHCKFHPPCPPCSPWFKPLSLYGQDYAFISYDRDINGVRVHFDAKSFSNHFCTRLDHRGNDDQSISLLLAEFFIKSHLPLKGVHGRLVH